MRNISIRQNALLLDRTTEQKYKYPKLFHSSGTFFCFLFFSLSFAAATEALMAMLTEAPSIHLEDVLVSYPRKYPILREMLDTIRRTEQTKLFDLGSNGARMGPGK